MAMLAKKKKKKKKKKRKEEKRKRQKKKTKEKVNAAAHWTEQYGRAIESAPALAVRPPAAAAAAPAKKKKKKNEKKRGVAHTQARTHECASLSAAYVRLHAQILQRLQQR